VGSKMIDQSVIVESKLIHVGELELELETRRN